MEVCVCASVWAQIIVWAQVSVGLLTEKNKITAVLTDSKQQGETSN